MRFFPLSLLITLTSCLHVQAQSLSIGIVQADGILLPVASYDGNEWVNPWPPFVREGDPPNGDLASIPPSWLPANRPLKRTWHLESFDGQSRPLNIHALVRTTAAQNICGGNLWGLATDAPPMLIECANCCPFPKIGYAIDQTLPIRRFEPVSRAPGAIGRLIESEFDRRESETVDLLSSSHATWWRSRGFPLEHDAREGQSISIDVLTFSRGSSSDGLFYYEASRKYPKPAGSPDPRCDWISVGSGWIQGTDARGIHLASQVTLSDCDRKGIGSLKPFATFDLGGATYAVAQGFGWESEEGVVLKFGSSVEELISTHTRAP